MNFGSWFAVDVYHCVRCSCCCCSVTQCPNADWVMWSLSSSHTADYDNNVHVNQPVTSSAMFVSRLLCPQTGGTCDDIEVERHVYNVVDVPDMDKLATYKQQRLTFSSASFRSLVQFPEVTGFLFSKTSDRKSFHDMGYRGTFQGVMLRG